MTYCKYCGYKIGVKVCCKKPECLITMRVMDLAREEGECPKCGKQNALVD